MPYKAIRINMVSINTMTQYVLLCVLVAASSCVDRALTQNGYGKWCPLNVDNADQLLNVGRSRRSLTNALKTCAAAFKSMGAARYLLKGAHAVHTRNGVTIYEKSGGFKVALMDFNSIKPQRITIYKTENKVELLGRIGDSEVHLLETYHPSTTSLTIRKIPKPQMALKIAYKDE